MIEDHRDLFKQIVAEAESLASDNGTRAERRRRAQVADRVQGVHQRAAAIDWG